MTGVSKKWPVSESATCLTKLHDIYLEQKYNRSEDFETKYTEKGTRQEEDGLTLLSRVIKKKLDKNKERLYNDYLTGEPDTYGKEEGYDVKCCWSLFTMPKPSYKLEPKYRYQNIGYIALTGCKRWATAFCLVNAPANLIINEKQKLWYKMDCPDDSNHEYIRKLSEIEKNMIFDMEQFKRDNPVFDHTIRDWTFDIPKEERVLLYGIERNEEEIENTYKRIRDCREYMNTNYNHANHY